MSYDPRDRIPSARQVVAAWVICLGIAGLALGMTVGRRDTATAAAADRTHVAKAAAPYPMTSLRIPRFVVCRADPPPPAPSASAKRGPVSVPIDNCS